jgi:hypothetical protein
MQPDTFTIDCLMTGDYDTLHVIIHKAQTQLEQEHGFLMTYVGRSERPTAAGVWVTLRFKAKQPWNTTR